MENEPDISQAFEKFLLKTMCFEPDVELTQEISQEQAENALSCMRSVELYYAFCLDIPREDYPDEFSDDEWEQIRVNNVKHAAFINQASKELRRGNTDLIKILDGIERKNQLEPEAPVVRKHLSLVPEPIDPIDVHGPKHDDFTAIIVPFLRESRLAA